MREEMDPEGYPVCPKCGGYIPNNDTPGAYPGALSREDNETMICSECGTREALNQILPENTVDQLVEMIRLQTKRDIVYVDVDSGTILNGPIYAVNSAYLSEDMTDDEARIIAKHWGKSVELPF